MATLLQDLRFGVRQLWHRPLFTLTAVLTLAIGIGVNTIAFSVVNGILYKDSWIGATNDMGRVETTPGTDESGYASLAEYERFVEATRGALDLAAEGRLTLAWRHDGLTETAWVLFVSPGYFSQVDAQPILGRVDVSASADGTTSVVIGERFWRRKLNAAPLSGLTLRLNDRLVAVAGVLPEASRARGGIYAPDVWLPLEGVAAFRTSAALQKPDERWLFTFGRLTPGTGAPEVQGRLDAAVAAMARDWPDTHRERGARFRRFSEGNSELRGARIAAAIAMGIIGLVLLLACFNVANLLLARAVERERDMGIRAALGSGVARLVRLVAIEGLLIATLAGLASIVLARWTQVLIGSFAIPIDQPQYVDLSPDWTVAGFIAVLVIVAGVLPGVWPAIAVARVDVLRALGSQGGTSSGGRPTPARRWLVGAQVAGSTAFLAIAALFLQSYARLEVADLGFERGRLLVAEVEPAAHGYGAAQSARYVDALLTRVRALPGVTDAAAADRAPFFIGYNTTNPVSTADVPCEPQACPRYATMAIGQGYFKAMGIPLTAGRELQVDPGAAEVVVNQPLAEQLWPDGRGVGELLRIGNGGRAVTVVGITARTATRALNRETPMLYVPLQSDHFERTLTVVARTAGPPASLVRPFVDAAHDVDPDVALLSAKTMEARIDVMLWPFRTVSWLFSICGVLALVLATVGLGGVVIHAVNRRRREFGVRLSIGATPRDIVVDVLRSSARLLVPGLAAGMLLAAGGARVVQSVFVGVDVLDPLSYIAVAIVECVMVAAASIGPALRASRVDPLVALRSE
jgi:predicted permease